MNQSSLKVDSVIAEYQKQLGEKVNEIVLLKAYINQIEEELKQAGQEQEESK